MNLGGLALVELYTGNMDSADAIAARALQPAIELGDRPEIARVCTILGLVN